ncbi:hypothetical protein HY745_03740 [Candidatus Desantisbacteria bacterium]|nr:hypothetical protein [Candidatus Desantisbacteria bacterium]
MNPSIIPLYYFCSIAGFIMVVGGIYLIYKQKIYIDRESKEITEIETPFGKFRTNVPALALFVLGFFPLIYPIVNISREVEKVQIKGTVTSNKYPVQVFAAIESYSLLKGSGEFNLQVPALKKTDKGYKIIYLVENTSDDAIAEISKQKDGEIILPEKKFLIGTSYQASTIPPRPDDF